MADGTDPPGPREGRRDPDSLPPRQEEGRLPSRPEECSHNPSVSGQLQEEEEVKEETHCSPREPSPDQHSSEELRRHRHGRHRGRRRGHHRRRSFSPVREGAAEVSFPHNMVSPPNSSRF